MYLLANLMQLVMPIGIKEESDEMLREVGNYKIKAGSCVNLTILGAGFPGFSSLTGTSKIVEELARLQLLEGISVDCSSN